MNYTSVPMADPYACSGYAVVRSGARIAFSGSRNGTHSRTCRERSGTPGRSVGTFARTTAVTKGHERKSRAEPPTLICCGSTINWTPRKRGHPERYPQIRKEIYMTPNGRPSRESVNEIQVIRHSLFRIFLCCPSCPVVTSLVEPYQDYRTDQEIIVTDW